MGLIGIGLGGLMIYSMIAGHEFILNDWRILPYALVGLLCCSRVKDDGDHNMVYVWVSRIMGLFHLVAVVLGGWDGFVRFLLPLANVKAVTSVILAVAVLLFFVIKKRNVLLETVLMDIIIGAALVLAWVTEPVLRPYSEEEYHMGYFFIPTLLGLLAALFCVQDAAGTDEKQNSSFLSKAFLVGAVGVILASFARLGWLWLHYTHSYPSFLLVQMELGAALLIIATVGTYAMKAISWYVPEARPLVMLGLTAALCWGVKLIGALPLETDPGALTTERGWMAIGGSLVALTAPLLYRCLMNRQRKPITHVSGLVSLGAFWISCAGSLLCFVQLQRYALASAHMSGSTGSKALFLAGEVIYAGIIFALIWSKREQNNLSDFRVHSEKNFTGEDYRELGLNYSIGCQGYPKDCEKAMVYLKKAAEMGDAKAMTELCDIYRWGMKGQQTDKLLARKYALMAAETGSVSGMIAAGEMLAEDCGPGYERDDSAAEIWLKKAVNQDRTAVRFLAKLYTSKSSSLYDVDKGELCIQKALEWCPIGAIYVQAGRFYQQIGDPARAGQIYEQAAEKGFTEAYVLAGEALLTVMDNGGNKTQHRLEEGYKVVADMFRIAAEKENRNAMMALGELYECRLHDDEMAIEWYQKAQKRGAMGAERAISNLKKKLKI